MTLADIFSFYMIRQVLSPLADVNIVLNITLNSNIPRSYNTLDGPDVKQFYHPEYNSLIGYYSF